MVALEGRWEEKKKRNCFQMVYIPKRVVEVFFYEVFFFSFLVFGLWFLTVALLAWRVVFCGLGLGFIIQHGGKFCPRLDLQVHVTFFLLMRWEEEWKGGRAASGRFLLEIENRQNSATVGLRGGFLFMRLVGT